MNIFVLDIEPKKCATYHCDKHIVKMILEYAQILSTAHRVLDGIKLIDKSGKRQKTVYHLNDNDNILYKATHVNHPCSIWARSSSSNYLWLFDLFNSCISEYSTRYKKIHSTSRLLDVLAELPKSIEISGISEHPICMPDIYKVENDPVLSYRNYYIKDKIRFATYKNSIPDWF